MNGFQWGESVVLGFDKYKDDDFVGLSDFGYLGKAKKAKKAAKAVQYVCKTAAQKTTEQRAIQFCKSKNAAMHMVSCKPFKYYCDYSQNAPNVPALPIAPPGQVVSPTDPNDYIDYTPIYAPTPVSPTVPLPNYQINLPLYQQPTAALCQGVANSVNISRGVRKAFTAAELSRCTQSGGQVTTQYPGTVNARAFCQCGGLQTPLSYPQPVLTPVVTDEGNGVMSYDMYPISDIYAPQTSPLPVIQPMPTQQATVMPSSNGVVWPAWLTPLSAPGAVSPYTPVVMPAPAPATPTPYYPQQYYQPTQYAYQQPQAAQWSSDVPTDESVGTEDFQDYAATYANQYAPQAPQAYMQPTQQQALWSEDAGVEYTPQEAADAGGYAQQAAPDQGGFPSVDTVESQEMQTLTGLGQPWLDRERRVRNRELALRNRQVLGRFIG